MEAFVLTVCMFMTDPGLNRCYDFAQEYQTIELCEAAGDMVSDKVIKSALVSGVASKCTRIEKDA